MPLLSQKIAELRVQKIAGYIKGDVLDIGCGHGKLRRMFGGQMTSYTGVDNDEASIEGSRRAHPGDRFLLHNIDEAPLPFDAEFDTVIMTAVIEHIFNLGILGQGIARSLRPGGKAVITTPTPFGNDIVHRLGAMIGLFNPVAVDDHIVIFNKKRFEIFAGEFGLNLAEHSWFQLGCNQIAVLERPA